MGASMPKKCRACRSERYWNPVNTARYRFLNC
jgi:hypothetical protein